MRKFHHLKSENSSVYKILESLGRSVSREEIWRPKEDVDFIFLCGANIGKSRTPSKRRQHLLEFADKNLPNTKFFFAEAIFDLLSKEGHKENILDVESELSDFADKIIIVLESESAFCELGAFASFSQLRDKIIVINDLQYEKSGSFINIGPVKAIEEISGKEKILYYNMEPKGREEGDGIGVIFSVLHKILHKKPSKTRSRVKNCDPNKFFTKDTIRFVHDLIYFSSPVNKIELSMMIRVVFGKSNDRKINNHIAFLFAIKEIERMDNGMYVSARNSPYFEYDFFDIYALIASFKNMYFRYDSARLP